MGENNSTSYKTKELDAILLMGDVAIGLWTWFNWISGQDIATENSRTLAGNRTDSLGCYYGYPSFKES